MVVQYFLTWHIYVQSKLITMSESTLSIYVMVLLEVKYVQKSTFN